jgi:hypothetical protein
LAEVVGGEGAEGLITAEVAAAGLELLGLKGDGATVKGDAGADGVGIGRETAELNGEARGNGFVTIDQSAFVEAVDHDVKIAIAVEVAQGHALGDADISEVPGL